jgi:hypothetical protein
MLDFKKFEPNLCASTHFNTHSPQGGEMQSICLVPTSDHPETMGDLHHVAAEAGQLAMALRSREAATLPPEVREALATLMDRLSRLPGASEDLCMVACAAAHLVAAILDPGEGMGSPLPDSLADIVAPLTGRLLALGLIDPWFLEGGAFGIWSSSAA